MQAGEVFAGRYRVERELGRGAMGVVYEAVDLSLGRPVALKTMAAAVRDDPAAHQRFLREARAAASLSHRNIVVVHDFGQADGLLFLTMQLVRGRSLADVLRSGPLRPTAAADLAEQLAAGLDAVHARGLVHRDVKPANVLLDEQDVAVLCDFGLAKPTDGSRSLTATGTTLGTVLYMSPEQVRCEEATSASDVYAFGCVLFHALAGSPPYSGATVHDVGEAHRHAPVPDVRTRVHGLPEGVHEVLARCLAKSPQDRWPSARAAAAQLRRAVSPAAATPAGTAPQPPHRTVVLERPPRPTPAPPPRRSRGLLAGCAAVVLLAGLVGGVVGFASPDPTRPLDGTTTAAGTSDPDTALAAALPVAVYGTACAPLERPEGVVASVKCTDVPGGGADELLVRRWQDPATMKADFAENYVGKPRRYTPGQCSKGTGHHSAWLRDDRRVGGLACRLDSTGPATIVWEYDDQAVQVVAVRTDRDSAALYAWWDAARRTPLTLGS